MNEQEVRIFDKERQEFYRLWHSYHAKYQIPYSHDEKEAFFNSIVLIFREDKSLEPKVSDIEKLIYLAIKNCLPISMNTEHMKNEARKASTAIVNHLKGKE